MGKLTGDRSLSPHYTWNWGLRERDFLASFTSTYPQDVHRYSVALHEPLHFHHELSLHLYSQKNGSSLVCSTMGRVQSFKVQPNAAVGVEPFGMNWLMSTANP